MRFGKTWAVGAALVSVAGSVPLLLLADQSASAGATTAAASSFRRPIADYEIAHPGPRRFGGHWVVLATGWWDTTKTISTAPKANGTWSLSSNHLLTGQPAWSSVHNHSAWGPSVIKVGTKYVVFYAALIRGETKKRCIGTGVSDSPTGPFTPRRVPISCIAGHGAPDPEPGVSRINTTIAATPSYLTVDGQRRLYLTYKTQHKKADGHYYSTIRMVRLNIASHASTVLGQSHRLTVRPNNIEENPVIVQRGNTFTMFTSLGGFKSCRYRTEWRQTTHIWKWPSTSHDLAFPGNTNTCGTGDAHVIRGLVDHTWRIFYSGHYPTPSDSFKMYVASMSWTDGTPRVSEILTRA